MISPPIYRGWVVLGIAILVFVLWAGVVTSWGTTILCFQQDEDFPSSSLAALGAPLTVYYAFKLSLSNFIYIALSKIGQLSLKQVIAVGLILMALGLLMTSLANEPLSVAISFGILSGSGSGLVLICTYLVVALWFPWSHKYHVFTTSAVNTLQPVGSAILNNLSAQMCSNPSLGWRWAFRIYTVILSSLGLLLLLLYGNPPEPTNEQRSDKKSDFLQKPPWTLGSKIAIYVIWGVAICCKGFAFHLPFVIIPKHITDLGYKEFEAEYVITVLSIMGMIGQMFFSWVGDYLKGNLLMANLVAAAVLAINNIIAAYSKSLTGAFIYSTVSGLAFGPFHACHFAVTNEIMEGENVRSLFLTMRFSKGIGATSGPYLAGYLRDVTGSYSAVFLTIASCFGVFVLAAASVIFIKKWRELRSIELMKHRNT